MYFGVKIDEIKKNNKINRIKLFDKNKIQFIIRRINVILANSTNKNKIYK